MEPKVPPRDKKGLRTGFTTGACAAAAAKAAARSLVRQERLERIETTLPNGQRVTFPLERFETVAGGAECGVIKDAGDDPDCTHGAELVATVELTTRAGIEILGGAGVARVTKPGLGLEVGLPAVNPVPRRNLTAMVLEELMGTPWLGARVTLRVPGGEEMAKQTLNGRLGLLGGISILGTSGIVRPYSTAAYRASVVQAIDVARTRGLEELVFTTGGRSEEFAMRLHDSLPEEAFIQMGDFVGIAMKHSARKGLRRAVIVGMMGKLSKMADGRMMTHAAGSQVNVGLLADLAAESGGTPELCAAIRESATARGVLELCAAAGLHPIAAAVCRRVVEQVSRHAGGAMEVHAYLVDFDGALLGRYPATDTGAAP